MKEVIQEILNEEKSARERLEAARTQARQATENAQINARQAVEAARTAALREAEQIIENARSEAAREQADLVHAANYKRDEVINANQAAIQKAVEFLTEKISNAGETLS